MDPADPSPEPAPVKPSRLSPRGAHALHAAIVLVGLALRLAGLTWSLPDARHPISTYHPDELINLHAAEQADLPHGKLDVGFYNYGAFYFYIVSLGHTVAQGYHLIPATAPAATPRDIVEFYRLRAPEQSAKFLVGRAITALMGVGTISVLFLLGRRLYGAPVGLLAALLYALAPLAVVHAHFLTVDVPATLFVALALLWAARLLTGPAWSEVAIAGVWCGLAAATKYTAVICLAAPLTALLLGARGEKGAGDAAGDGEAPTAGEIPRTGSARPGGGEGLTAGKPAGAGPAGGVGVAAGLGRQADAGAGARAVVDPVARVRGAHARCAILLATACIVFLIACPGPWVNPAAFTSAVQYELFEHSRAGHGYLFVNTGPGWWYHLTVSLRYGLGLPLLLLSIAGLAYAVRRREPADVVLATFLLVGYAAMSFSAVRFARYLIPLYPALCVLGARAVFAPYRTNALRRVAWCAAAAVVISCGVTSASLVRAMVLPDPRDRAADYLAVKAQPHATVAFAHIPWFYSPPLSPLWGALRPDIRTLGPPDPPIYEFRIPDGDWDPRVLVPTPNYVVLSNIEIGTDWKRLRMESAVKFINSIPADSKIVRFDPAPTPGLSPDDADVPQDLLYVIPQVTIYEPPTRMTAGVTGG